MLDPHPSQQTIRDVLGPYGFGNCEDAYHNLMALATERISFLSTRRCGHFQAAIAPQLLAAIARTPDPGATLVNLSKVSDSLGGKGVLWELFSSSAASLQLYVQLCASSPYLSGILTSNPGMIDELMDSLMLDRLPTRDTLSRALNELCRGAEDVEPILHSFKNSQQSPRRRQRHLGQGRYSRYAPLPFRHRGSLSPADCEARNRAPDRTLRRTLHRRGRARRWHLPRS